MPRFALAAAVLLALLAPPLTHAQDRGRGVSIPREWAPYEQFDQAHEAAQKSGRILAVLAGDRDSDDKNHNDAFVRVLNDGSLRGTVRVFLGDNSPPAAIQAPVKQAKTNGAIPRLYLISPAGQLVGVVTRGTVDRTREVVALANQVVAWQASAQRKITAADQLAQNARYADALDDIDRLVKEDMAISARVREVIEPKKEEKKDDKDKADADDRRNRRQREEPQRPEPLPPGYYFPTLHETKKDEYRKLAAERIAEAKKLIDEGNPGGARAKVAPMVNDKSEFPEIEEARQVLQQAAAAAAGSRQ